MQMNAVDLIQSLWANYANLFDTSESSVSKDGSLAACGKLADRIDISTFGKFRKELSQLSEDEKEEMRAFHEEMMEAIKNGTFDASEMAANAPDALKSFAEENGIDLETLLTDQATWIKEHSQGNEAPPRLSTLYGNYGFDRTYQSQ